MSTLDEQRREAKAQAAAAALEDFVEFQDSALLDGLELCNGCGPIYERDGEPYLDHAYGPECVMRGGLAPIMRALVDYLQEAN